MTITRKFLTVFYNICESTTPTPTPPIFVVVYAEEGENTEPKQGILGKNITYEQG